MIRFSCQTCKNTIEAEEQFVGLTIKCAKCKTSLTVPMSGDASEPAPDEPKLSDSQAGTAKPKQSDSQTFKPSAPDKPKLSDSQAGAIKPSSSPSHDKPKPKQPDSQAGTPKPRPLAGSSHDQPKPKQSDSARFKAKPLAGSAHEKPKPLSGSVHGKPKPLSGSAHDKAKPKSDSSRPGKRKPSRPIWLQMFFEIKEVPFATLGQTFRLLRYSLGGWRLRRLRRAAGKAQDVLGKRLTSGGLGDQKFRKELADLDEKIKAAREDKISTRGLDEERRTLVRYTAAALMNVEVVKGAEKEHLQAKRSWNAFKKYEEKRGQLRAALVPEGVGGWGRLLVGYGLIAGLVVAAFLFQDQFMPQVHERVGPLVSQLQDRYHALVHRGERPVTPEAKNETPPVVKKEEPRPTPEVVLTEELALVPRDAVFFAYLRVAELLKTDLMKAVREQVVKEAPGRLQEFEKAVGVPLAEVETVGLFLPKPEGAGMVTQPQPLVVVTTSRPYTRSKVLEALAPQAEEKKVQDKSYHVTKGERATAVHFVSDRMFLVGVQAAPVLQKYLATFDPKKTDGPMSAALKTASATHHLVAAVTPEGLDKQVGELPPQVLPFKPLLQTRVATLVLDLGAETKLDLGLAFAGEDQAKEAEQALTAGLAMARAVVPELAKGMAALTPILGPLEAMLKEVPIEQKGKDVKLALRLKLDPSLPEAMFAARSSLPDTDARALIRKNLDLISLAMQTFHVTRNAFPPAAIYAADGKPLLSWRVAILPFFFDPELKALYGQFKLNEPWDSANNKKLLARMPAVYAPPPGMSKDPTLTFYQVFTGPGATGKDPMFAGKKPMDLGQFQAPDSAERTLMIAEGGKPVPWTKPDDLNYAADKPLPGLGGVFKDGFHVIFADGQVRFLKKGLDDKLLHALITWNGKEMVTLPD